MTVQPGALPMRVSSNQQAMLLLLKLRTFIALFAVIIFFSIAVPNFLDFGTIIIMAKHVALNGLLAIGMTFVIITEGIDLSVGSIVGLTGMCAGWRLRIRGLLQPLRDHRHRSVRWHSGRRGQRDIDHQAQRSPVHRDARNALRRTRAGAVVIRRPDISQSEWQQRI
jgi:hypothetical protein